jgi:phage shock protein PspC (stress-responsive transcriptional regulator)
MGTEVKKLYRSREDRVLGGVCGGLAEYLALDSTLIRLLFVVFALAGGPGLLAYIIMLFVVPEKPLE